MWLSKAELEFPGQKALKSGYSGVGNANSAKASGAPVIVPPAGGLVLAPKKEVWTMNRGKGSG